MGCISRHLVRMANFHRRFATESRRLRLESRLFRMTTATDTISPQSLMSEVLQSLAGAQRALFRKYHIGGCGSFDCAFRPDESLAQVLRAQQQPRRFRSPRIPPPQQ